MSRVLRAANPFSAGMKAHDAVTMRLLRRFHNNAIHVANETLAVRLKALEASEHVLQLCRILVCDACVPTSGRP